MSDASAVARKRALDKVRKCLELGKSSNPHEAETALRQARKLMDKHQLEQSDVLASQVESVELQVGKGLRMPPLWVRMLSELVASAFGCIHLIQRVRGVGTSILFIGPGGNGEIAKYAYEVLSRQLQVGKRNFFSRFDALETGVKRKMGARYAEQWLISVHDQVKSFSGMDEESERAVSAYMEKHFPETEHIKPRRRPKLSQAEMVAAIAGSEDGEKVSIYVPVNSDPERPSLLGFAGD